MKRLLSISLLAVACAALVSPDPAHAGKWKDKWKEKKDKKGKKGKKGKSGHDHGHGHDHHDDDDGHGGGHGHDHDDDDDGGGGGGGGGGGSTAGKLQGAGQLGSISFGGKIVATQWGVKGIFIVDVHPIAPSTTALSIACRFTRFQNFVVTGGNRVTFRGTGGCRILRTDGSIDITQNVNDFQIVDSPGGDVIESSFVGSSTGVAIPQGTLEFGDLIVTPPS